MVATSHQFFDLRIAQSNGYIPKLLHLDSPLDQKGKIARLAAWNLALDSDEEQPNLIVKSAPYKAHSSLPDTTPANHVVKCYVIHAICMYVCMYE